MYLKKGAAFVLAALLALSLCACGGDVEGTEPEQTQTERQGPTQKGLRDALSAVESQDESLSQFSTVPGEVGDYCAATLYNKGAPSGNVVISEDALFIIEVRMMPLYAQDHALAALRYLAPEDADEAGAHLLVTPDYGTTRAYDAAGYRFVCYTTMDGLDTKYTLVALDGGEYADYKEGKAWVNKAET